MAKYISIIFMICVFTFKIRGKEIDHWGTHFILTFMDTLNNVDAKNILIITAREPTQVKVIFHQTNHRIFYDLPTNGIQRVEFTDLSIAVPFGIVLKDKAISVEASAKVSVYAYSYLHKTSDGLLVLPVASLGLEYITVTLGNYPQTLIIAIENDTVVNVHHRWHYSGFACIDSNLNLYTPNIPSQYIMQSYDVINICCTSDTSGTRISASKPVAVIVASESVGWQNFHSEIVEMLPPMNNFGTVFSLLPPHGHNGDAMIKIIATQQWQTTIKSMNYGAVAGQFQNISIVQGDKICFTTTNPVLVVLFMTGTQYVSNPRGNSFMMVIPPVTKYSTDYVIPTNILNAYDSSYVNQVDVIAKLPFTVPMNPGLSYYNLCGDYSYNSSVNVLNDVIHYKGEPAFLVLMYGYTYGDGYGFPAGMALTDYTGADECSSSPCQNGGWCVETVVAYECYCHNSRYEGELCEIDTVNDCHDNPCMNGICTDYSGYYICDCDAGYTDYNCSTHLSTTLSPEPSTPQPTISGPTTPGPTTPEPTTPRSTTTESTTSQPTTTEYTTPESTTSEPTTPQPTTKESTTPQPSTQESITPNPTTTESTTAESTTLESTTSELTTPQPTTPESTTPQPTTQESTTPSTTQHPTTTESTTPEPTTSETTTPQPATPDPTTPQPTTTESTTPQPTTSETTTPESTSLQPTTAESTTPEPTTPESTTPEPTKTESTTPEPTTPESTTPEPTSPESTPNPTTTESTTPEPTTPESTTPESTTPESTPNPTTTESRTPEPTTPETTTQHPTTTESTTPDTTTPASTTLQPTTTESTTPEPTPESTSAESTTPEPTTPEPTKTESTTPEPTTPESTTQHPTTTESTTSEPTTPESTTPEPTTPETTTPEITYPAPTTSQPKTHVPTKSEPKTPESTTQEPTTPTTSDLTTGTTQTPLNQIKAKKRYCNGNLCMCRCPCAEKCTKSQIQNYTLQKQNKLSIEKKILSKTVRKKISAENLTQSESTLGISSTVFVTSVILVIIFMDISKMYVWLLSKYHEYKWRQSHVRPL